MRLARPLTALLALAAVAAGTSAAGQTGASFSARTTNSANTFSAARDWTPPIVTVTDPGSPLKGTVTFRATAADNISGVAKVVLQAAPTGSATYTDLCTATVSPYACTADTKLLADGSYSVRAVATDVDGNVGTSAAVASRVVDNLAPVVKLTPLPGVVRQTFTVSATASDAGTGIASVRLEYALTGTTTWTAICTPTASPYSCALDTTKLTTDLYDMRAVATDGVGNITTSALDTTQVDNVAPLATTTDPGATLTGTVTLEGTATDDDSGIDRVVLQYSPSGSTTWTDVCTVSPDPYRCAWDTTKVADGLYSVRAVAYDAAGNSTIATPVTNRRVDNTIASVTMVDPGDVLRGSVTLNAAASSPVGVTSVAIQRAPAGSTTFTTVCTDTTAPFSCPFVTTTVADGLYDVRAVMTYGAALTKTSATITNRRIDNAPFRGVDVKALNSSNGALGKVEAGDTAVFTYSQALTAATLVPGWSGTGSVAIRAVVTDNASADTLSFTTSGGAATTGLGTVNLRGNYVRKNKTVTYNATLTVSGAVATVTFGTTISGAADARQATTAANITWTPSALAKDTTGAACSTTPVTESGTTARDF